MSKKCRQFCEEEIRGDTAELATKKGRQVFQEENRGVTPSPSVAAPGVTHPSDATESGGRNEARGLNWGYVGVGPST